MLAVAARRRNRHRTAPRRRRPGRLLVVEVSEAYPQTFGHGEHRHAVHVGQIDILVRSTEVPLALPSPPPTDTDIAIARHAVTFIPSGATLQTGIGSIPS